MNGTLVDAFRHNAWATNELLEFCIRLNEEQLRAETTGTCGSTLATLKHLLGAEAYYRFLFVGDFPVWGWIDDELPTLRQMQEWATYLESFWKGLLSSELDQNRLLIQLTPEGARHEAIVGVVLAQALHHGNVHREQVCTILTTLGVESPDLDVWSFAAGEGRGRSITPAS
jgi:uncharacterized damage-inducible protein DinB